MNSISNENYTIEDYGSVGDEKAIDHALLTIKMCILPFFVMIASGIYVCAQAHQDVYIQYVQLFVYHAQLNEVEKICRSC